MLSVADLARGMPPRLGLDASGVPTAPCTLVDLDSALNCSPSEIGAAATVLGSALAVSIGVATGAPPAEADLLLEAATFSVAPTSSDRRVVGGADVAEVVDAVRRTPLASVTLAGLLRQTAVLPVRAGLLAESTAYSTLLAGPEFAAWLAGRGPSRRDPGDGPPVRVDRVGDAVRVVLDRPQRRNAVNAAVRDALVDALLIAVADESVTIELSGAGPHFSTGGDLDEFGTAKDPATAHVIRSEQSVGWAIERCRERVRAVVHGRCMGAGVEIPAFAGTVVAAPDTTFSLPELSLGLVPGAGGTVSVTRRIGRWRTAWMALTGASVDAGTALQWGLVDVVD